VCVPNTQTKGLHWSAGHLRLDREGRQKVRAPFTASYLSHTATFPTDYSEDVGCAMNVLITPHHHCAIHVPRTCHRGLVMFRSCLGQGLAHGPVMLGSRPGKYLEGSRMACKFG